MKKEEHEDLNTLEFNLLDNVKNEVKIHKLKYIIITIVTLLFLISLSILFFLTINHSKQINEFKKQTDDLKKENTEIFELLYNKTNETKMQLLEKESEINNLKSIIDNLSNDIKILEKNLKQKDEEILKQNTLNFNRLKDNIINLENKLEFNEEEYFKQNLTNYIL